MTVDGVPAFSRRTGDDLITGEQAALRRVATLVARGTPPEQVFAAVTEEAGRLLGAHQATMTRYVPDGTTVVAAWGKAGAAFPVGSRWSLGGRNVLTLVFETGQPSRTEDDYVGVSDPITEAARRQGLRSLVGVPINVEGRLWGVMLVGTTRAEPLPSGTEVRLAGFTELAATAIANAQARVDLRGFADEQAALRRVATLVARGTPPGEVFAAVAAEVGRLLGVDFTFLSRYGVAHAATIAGSWARTATAGALSAGSRWDIGGRNLHTIVFRTRRPARINDYTGTLGPVSEAARETGVRSAVAVPISVEGHIWGVMIVGSMREEPLPADTESRLAGFTELAATAIANAASQAALTASRARIVATADQTRRRIERDLHDGAQQRLVSLALAVRAAQAEVPPASGDLPGRLARVADELTSILDDLRELARGIHPSILSEGGLVPALKTLARRSVVPVELDVRAVARLPEPIEVAAYYVVSEALANAAKHSNAPVVRVGVEVLGNVLHVRIHDDGVGGADPALGSGLMGLKDRVEALGGMIAFHSPVGGGTSLDAELPLAI